jgi:hypothetical protein
MQTWNHQIVDQLRRRSALYSWESTSWDCGDELDDTFTFVVWWGRAISIGRAKEETPQMRELKTHTQGSAVSMQVKDHSCHGQWPFAIQKETWRSVVVTQAPHLV